MRTVTIGTALGLGCILSMGTPCAAEQIVYRDGLSNAFVDNYDGTDDNTLISGSFADTNWGGFNQGAIGPRGSSTQFRRQLLRFDLSSMMGQYSSINSVTLRLTIEEGSYRGPLTYSVYAVIPENAGWVEGTQANAVEVGASNWNYMVHDTTAWVGGPGLGTTGYTPISGLSGLVWDFGDPLDIDDRDGVSLDLTLPVALIESWIHGPNGGLLFKADIEDGTQGIGNFRSSEWSDPETRPALIIDYAPVPEPATLGLLIGGIFLSRRGWRKEIAG